MAGWAGGSDKVKVCCWWRVEAEALTATVSAPHMNRHTRLQLSMEAACHASRAPDLPQLRSLRRPAGSRRPRPRTRVPRTATPTTVALRSQWSPTNQTAMLAPRPHPSRLSQARRSDRGPPVPARPVPPQLQQAATATTAPPPPHLLRRHCCGHRRRCSRHLGHRCHGHPPAPPAHMPTPTAAEVAAVTGTVVRGTAAAAGFTQGGPAIGAHTQAASWVGAVAAVRRAHSARQAAGCASCRGRHNGDAHLEGGRSEARGGSAAGSPS